MAKLACRTCGRQVYTAAPPEALLAAERRCPRCGARLDADRRLEDRRQYVRRVNPPSVPGPPAGIAERRMADRRVGRRRTTGDAGWQPR
jgi:DNA-directed RNA polymerase subunit RPC12/RpoP